MFGCNHFKIKLIIQTNLETLILFRKLNTDLKTDLHNRILNRDIAPQNQPYNTGKTSAVKSKASQIKNTQPSFSARTATNPF